MGLTDDAGGILAAISWGDLVGPTGGLGALLVALYGAWREHRSTEADDVRDDRSLNLEELRFIIAEKNAENVRLNGELASERAGRREDAAIAEAQRERIIALMDELRAARRGNLSE